MRGITEKRKATGTFKRRVPDSDFLQVQGMFHERGLSVHIAHDYADFCEQGGGHYAVLEHSRGYTLFVCDDLADLRDWLREGMNA